MVNVIYSRLKENKASRANVVALAATPGCSPAHNLGHSKECLPAQHNFAVQHNFVAYHTNFAAQQDFVAQSDTKNILIYNILIYIYSLILHYYLTISFDRF